MYTPAKQANVVTIIYSNFCHSHFTLYNLQFAFTLTLAPLSPRTAIFNHWIIGHESYPEYTRSNQQQPKYQSQNHHPTDSNFLPH